MKEVEIEKILSDGENGELKRGYDEAPFEARVLIDILMDYIRVSREEKSTHEATLSALTEAWEALVKAAIKGAVVFNDDGEIMCQYCDGEGTELAREIVDAGHVEIPFTEADHAADCVALTAWTAARGSE